MSTRAGVNSDHVGLHALIVPVPLPQGLVHRTSVWKTSHNYMPQLYSSASSYHHTSQYY
jgi:hypothetical protein